MERIWNSSSNDNLSVRRFSNTVNLKIGQRVYGRVIKMSDEQQAIIKLLNGMELQAEIDGLVDEFENMLMNFKVEGMKDGKLQLKVIQGQKNPNTEGQNELLKFITKEGMTKEDIPMLESMLKFDIPLTKENISEVKGLIQFQEKLQGGGEEAKSFINNYINSKGIDINSPRGEFISGKLTDFMNNFKDFSVDDILLFLENNIDFDSDSINSYNKIIKGDQGIFDVLGKIDQSVDKLEVIIPKEIKEITLDKNIKEVVVDLENEISPKEIEGFIKNKTEVSKELASILRDNKFAINSKSAEVLFNIIDKTIEESIQPTSIKELAMSSDTIERIFTKPMLEEALTKAVGEKITVSDEKYEKLCNELGIKSDKDTPLSKSENTMVNLKEVVITKEAESKEIIKNIITLLSSGSDAEEQVALMQLIKSSISEVKLFNKFSDQYYYLNLPLEFKEKEYPCKLVIKDDRKEGKKIDSKNLKIALNIKTSNLGNIDSFVKINNKHMNIEIKCEEKIMKAFEVSKHKLKEKIEESGFNASITISKCEEEFSLSSCRGFFGDNNIAGIDIKV